MTANNTEILKKKLLVVFRHALQDYTQNKQSLQLSAPILPKLKKEMSREVKRYIEQIQDLCEQKVKNKQVITIPVMKQFLKTNQYGFELTRQFVIDNECIPRLNIDKVINNGTVNRVLSVYSTPEEKRMTLTRYRPFKRFIYDIVLSIVKKYHKRMQQLPEKRVRLTKKLMHNINKIERLQNRFDKYILQKLRDEYSNSDKTEEAIEDLKKKYKSKFTVYLDGKNRKYTDEHVNIVVNNLPHFDPDELTDSDDE